MAEPLTKSAAPRLFLLDAMALAYRAHFAFMNSRLSNAQGIATGAVFGFLAAIDRVLKDERPEEIVVVWDGPEDTFRHKMYPAYKATREKMPEEMIPQLAWMRQAVKALGLASLQVSGYEADDIIGTLAVREAEAGKDVWIVSGDKDFMQLVTDKVRLYNVMKQGQQAPDLVGIDETVEKFGVPPEQVIDVLGLMGDASDNVPGVPRVGIKTAIKLIHQYGSIDNLLEHAEDVPQPALKKNLIEFADQARLSRELVTIALDVPIDDSVSLAPGEADIPALRALYADLDFKGRLERLDADDADDAGEVQYHIIKTKAAFKTLVKALQATKKSGGFTWDTETTGLNPHNTELVGLSFSWEEGEAWYVPVNNDPPMFGNGDGVGGAGSKPQLGQHESGLLFGAPPAAADTDQVVAALKGVLEDPDLPKCGQNLKYDIHVVAQPAYGIEVRGVDFDTMVASFCLEPGSRIHNLDGLALRHLSIKKIPTSDLIGKGKNQITMAEVAVDTVGHYACEDADVTLRLRNLFAKELVEKQVERVFREAEMPLLPVLVRMEQAGIKLDAPQLAKMSKDFERRIEGLEKKIHSFSDEPFNIRSTAMLGKLLFETLELHKLAGRRKPKKTAKGTGYATDEATLGELAAFHELPRLILEYRSYAKLLSTYVDTLPTYISARTGRIHTSFHQTGAATGRLSSSDPNLQNIPIRSEEGRAIRSAFVPETGNKFLSADYSQVELRLLAQLSGDEGLREAFRRGEDIHRATAARIFKVPLEEVTPVLRSRAKAVNFGVIYGMGPQRLARETNVTLKEARGFIDEYFETYPGVKAYQERTVEEAKETGYVTTLIGRRRYLPGLVDSDPRVQAQAVNVAVNTPLQGTAADMIKLAMIRIDARLRSDDFKAQMLLQIHDELLFEVPEDEIERLTQMVRAEMETALPLDVPVVVDIGIGDNWSEAH